MSNLINKAKDALSSNKHDNTGTSGTHYNDPHSTNAGPHSSNIMNQADPRIDSDRDNRNDPTSRTGGYGNTQDNYGTHGGAGLNSGNAGYGGTHGNNGSGLTGAHGATTHGGAGGIGGTHGTSGGSTNAGPHNSNLLNKVDPRVDSDRDGRSNPTSHTGGYGQTQSHGTTGSGLTGSHGTHNTTGTHGGVGGIGGTHGTSTGQYDNPRSTNEGPHGSNVLNQVDPRVDSDRDGRAGGLGHTQGNTGAGYNSNTGTHGAGIGNNSSSGATTSSNLPSTQKNAHSSDLLNRLDPRVKTDSQGNPTH